MLKGLYVLESNSPVNQERLVCISLANSETGVIQPVADLVRQLRAMGPVWVHCDGVQAAGRIALNIKELDVDSFALAAHKFGGVPGIGALLLKPGASIKANITWRWAAIGATTWNAPSRRSHELNSSAESVDS